MKKVRICAVMSLLIEIQYPSAHNLLFKTIALEKFGR